MGTPSEVPIESELSWEESTLSGRDVSSEQSSGTRRGISSPSDEDKQGCSWIMCSNSLVSTEQSWELEKDDLGAKLCSSSSPSDLFSSGDCDWFVIWSTSKQGNNSDYEKFKLLFWIVVSWDPMSEVCSLASVGKLEPGWTWLWRPRFWLKFCSERHVSSGKCSRWRRTSSFPSSNKSKLFWLVCGTCNVTGIFYS